MTASTVPATAPSVVDRVNFAFSADGRQAACVRMDEAGCALEVWTFHPESTGPRVLSHAAVDPAASVLPLGNGQVLVFPNRGEQHELTLFTVRAGRPSSARELGTIHGLGGYLVPSPNSAELGYLVARADLHRSVIWRIRSTPPAVTPVLELPGAAADAVWLDGAAGILAVNLARHGEPTDGVLVDLRRPGWKRFFSAGADSNDRIVACSPSSRLLVVASTAPGQDRLGWIRLGEKEVRFPDGLHRDGYPRQVLAVDREGERLLLHEQDGACSAVLSYRVDADHVRRLPVPPGTVRPPASWSARSIRLPFSAPACPPTLLDLAPDGCGFAITGGAESVAAAADATRVEVAGAGGGMEAIVYGNRGWRDAAHLVIALHGGPLSSWRLEYSPLFQDLAAAGVAVCAPNYRGSVGYGTAHARAIVGQWGGPDLDDVLCLADELVWHRDERGLPPPVLLGASYGAFLALLAAAARPRWSACIALAPFLSGRRLHAAGNPWVAARIARLGALDEVADALGRRDVLTCCDRISAPLLLVHGSDDDVIPVHQSRTLRRRLLAFGRREGRDFHYLEVPGGHHQLAATPPASLRGRIATFARSQEYR